MKRSQMGMDGKKRRMGMVNFDVDLNDDGL